MTRDMYVIGVFLALIVVLVHCAKSAKNGMLTKPSYNYGDENWKLTFVDEFDGNELDENVWNVKNNMTHCSPCELQLYVTSGVTVQDSNLILTTQRANVTDTNGVVYEFTSGWVDTKGKFSQKYGLFETRAKLPSRSATGIWPAFWTLPDNDNVCWPIGGEIDVFEYTANPADNHIYGSYRWGVACGEDKQVLPGAAYPPLGQPAISWEDDFHIFATAWNETALTFYVDGVEYETKDNTQVNLPMDNQYVIMDAAVAWYMPPGPKAVYPATTTFDWVRVYTWEE